MERLRASSWGPPGYRTPPGDPPPSRGHFPRPPYSRKAALADFEEGGSEVGNFLPAAEYVRRLLESFPSRGFLSDTLVEVRSLFLPEEIIIFYLLSLLLIFFIIFIIILLSFPGRKDYMLIRDFFFLLVLI